MKNIKIKEVPKDIIICKNLSEEEFYNTYNDSSLSEKPVVAQFLKC